MLQFHATSWLQTWLIYIAGHSGLENWGYSPCFWSPLPFLVIACLTGLYYSLCSNEYIYTTVHGIWWGDGPHLEIQWGSRIPGSLHTESDSRRKRSHRNQCFICLHGKPWNAFAFSVAQSKSTVDLAGCRLFFFAEMTKRSSFRHK